jgi:hypothetical protein
MNKQEIIEKQIEDLKWNIDYRKKQNDKDLVTLEIFEAELLKLTQQ